MRFRSRKISAWLGQVHDQWGPEAADLLAPHRRTLRSRSTADVAAALDAIGAAAAHAGVPLAELLGWFDPLWARPKRSVRRAPLRHLATITPERAVVILAHRWVASWLTRPELEASPAPLELIRLRLLQQYAGAAAHGLVPGSDVALVVAELGGGSSHTADALAIAHRIFSSGETVAAAANGSVFVLARRDHRLVERTHDFTRALQRLDQFQDARPRVWIEPLGSRAEHLDAHLLGLAS